MIAGLVRTVGTSPESRPQPPWLDSWSGRAEVRQSGIGATVAIGKEVKMPKQRRSNGASRCELWQRRASAARF